MDDKEQRELKLLREYVGDNMLKDDYKTVDDMRRALDYFKAETRRLREMVVLNGLRSL